MLKLTIFILAILAITFAQKGPIVIGGDEADDHITIEVFPTVVERLSVKYHFKDGLTQGQSAIAICASRNSVLGTGSDTDVEFGDKAFGVMFTCYQPLCKDDVIPNYYLQGSYLIPNSAGDGFAWKAGQKDYGYRNQGIFQQI